MRNLDLACAKLGKDIAEIEGLEEKTINAALSVLEEQGIYACFLYLQARDNKEKAGKAACSKLASFLKQEIHLDESTSSNPEIIAEKVSEDLDRLLFARELLSRAMVYARYHLKARSGSSAAS